ncbi:DUF2497 domain-containing protein [Jiella sp. 40Bstr34]|uniref:DUF2497 domain-containing protein n=1 Tax=Jiella pacifica TaxID=2696469 RepID=A0A6N9T1G0_9HYPH|nr:DUF2497 domain-containing protein [Jiella pacifica]NDW05160.1 DUF2497 domain-containing protein [Jiella pacifica]
MSNALPARDQSMDEILASIRRIIETGDERLGRTSATGGNAVRAIAGAPAEPAIGGVSAAQPQRETTPRADDIAQARRRAEQLATAGEQPVHDDAASSNAVSDASRVSANAPRTIRRQAAGSEAEMPEWPQAIAANDRYVEVAAEMFVEEFDEKGFADELLRGAIVGEEHAEVAADALDGEDPEDATPAAHFRSSFDPEPATEAEPVVAAPLEDEIQVAHALVSRESGERVAASFSDLAAAIRDEHLRDADQVVREVVRPMLQEWLDENLPRLVENLVREEIERIARGNAR